MEGVDDNDPGSMPAYSVARPGAYERIRGNGAVPILHLDPCMDPYIQITLISVYKTLNPMA